MPSHPSGECSQQSSSIVGIEPSLGPDIMLLLIPAGEIGPEDEMIYIDLLLQELKSLIGMDVHIKPQPVQQLFKRAGGDAAMHSPVAAAEVQ